MRMGFVPEVEIPHLKASCFNWASLRAVGILSAIHGCFVLLLAFVLRSMSSRENAKRVKRL